MAAGAGEGTRVEGTREDVREVGDGEKGVLVEDVTVKEPL